MGAADVAQRGPAGQVRPVAEALDGDLRQLTHPLEQRGGEGVGGVALGGAVLDNDAAAQDRPLPGVGVLGMGGVNGVGVVGGDQKAVPQGRVSGLTVPLHAAGDPGEHVGEEGGVCSLPGAAANLLIVEDAQHRDALSRLRGQKAPQTGKDTLQVVQPGGGDEISVRSQQRAGSPGIQEKLRGEKIRL